MRGTLKNRVEGEHELFGFLTTAPNADVIAVHEKAMPAIITTPEEIDLWMNAPINEALSLHRPLTDGALRIVRSGIQEDQP